MELSRKLGECLALCADLFGFAAQDDAIDSQAFRRFDGVAVFDVLGLFGREVQARS